MRGTSPRAWLVRARRGGRGTRDMQLAPFVAGSRTPGREGGHLISRTPRLWTVCASRGGRGTRERHLAPVVAGARTPAQEGDT